MKKLNERLALNVAVFLLGVSCAFSAVEAAQTDQVIVTGKRRNDDVSWARAKVLQSLETAVKERRLLLVHPQDTEQRMSSVDPSNDKSVLQGFIVEGSIPGVPCFVNPVLSWHILGGDQEIINGHYNIGLKKTTKAYAILGFSFSPINQYNATKGADSIFVYVDMLARDDGGAYVSTTGAIKELYSMDAVDQRVVLSRKTAAKYICLSGPEQIGEKIRNRILMTTDKSIVWAKFLSDTEYRELDQVYANENVRIQDINASVLRITNRDPYSYGTLVMVNYSDNSSRSAYDGSKVDQKWLGCLPTDVAANKVRKLDCNSGKSFDVLDPFDVLKTISGAIKKFGDVRDKYKGTVFPVTNLPVAAISSKPPGADVYIDEEEQSSKTNDDYTLSENSIVGVRIEKEGYESCAGVSLKKRIVSDAPKVYKIDCRMRPVKQHRRR